MITNIEIADNIASQFCKKKVIIEEIKGGGSERQYFRARTDDKTFIVVFGANQKENDAFFHFTEAIGKVENNIPKILNINYINKGWYILNDLGNLNLLKFLQQERKSNPYITNSLNLYIKVLRKLAVFQFEADKHIDYSFCWQSSFFGYEDMIFDIHYFIEQFLSLFVTDNSNISIIKKELYTLAEFLSTTEHNYFLYRDFQARNIIINNNEPYFIDYQGGRKGPVFYDAASLINQAKAELNLTEKELLKNEYYEILKNYINITKVQYEIMFYGFSFLRILQTLGAYGLRGIKENKPHFVESIPLALNNLLILIKNNPTDFRFFNLNEILEQISKYFQ